MARERGGFEERKPPTHLFPADPASPYSLGELPFLRHAKLLQPQTTETLPIT